MFVTQTRSTSVTPHKLTIANETTPIATNANGSHMLHAQPAPTSIEPWHNLHDSPHSSSPLEYKRKSPQPESELVVEEPPRLGRKRKARLIED